MTIAVLQIGFMETDGTVTKFILNESGNLSLCLQATAKHDCNVPNFNHRGEHITTRIPIDKLLNWIISSGYKLHTVLPSVYDESRRQSPEKYIFEKANHM